MSGDALNGTTVDWVVLKKKKSLSGQVYWLKHHVQSKAEQMSLNKGGCVGTGLWRMS